MIYELLSTALLATSLNFIQQPKRAFDNLNSVYGNYELMIEENTCDFRAPFRKTGSVFNMTSSGNFEYTLDTQEQPQHPNWKIHAYSNLNEGEYWEFSFAWCFDTEEKANTFLEDLGNAVVNEADSNMHLDDKYIENDEEGFWVLLNTAYEYKGSSTAEFIFSVNHLTTYSVTKTFKNCHDSGNTDYRVPDSFTNESLNNPYTILVISNDGYFFKTDGSCYSFSPDVVVTSVQYGANPTAPKVPYSEMMFITFSMPANDVSMTFTAQTITLADVNGLYNQGYQDAKGIYGENVQFKWIKNVFDGMEGLFNIQILPNISLGFLMFAPIVVVAIVAIVRIIKHE